MKLRILFCAVTVLIINSASAQLLQWNTFGNAGTETSEPSVANNANVSAASLTLGGGVTAVGNANRFGGNNWFDTGDTATTTLAESVSGNDYIQFTVTPNAGYSFTPTSFVFGWDRSSTGPGSVTLRSSVDGYAADLGSVTGMAASQTNGNTITISGLSNITSATTFRLYGYAASATGGTGGFDTTGAINVVLNGTTTAVGPYTVASGDWANPATWSTNPMVPTNTDNVTITAGHVVYTNASLTRTGTTTVNGAFQLNAGGYATGANFTYGASGTLNFNNTATYGVANTDVFWPTTSGPVNVNVLQGGLTMSSANRTVAGIFSTKAGVTLNSSALTIGASGTCRIDIGGFFANVSPTYTTGSLLLYNAGTVYNRQLEWTGNAATAGNGTPYNVQISNNTTLNYINASNSGAKAIVNNLIIDSGSALYMDYGSISSAGALTVGKDFTNNGSFSMGFASGDDLKLGGNFVNTSTFNGNSRAVFFTKNGAQTVSSTTALTFPYVVFQPVSGNTTVQLLSSLTVSAPSAGNAISFSGASDVFDINGNTLTIGTAGIANVISGSGTFKGSATSNLTLLGLNSIGTLNFTTGFQNLGTFTMNRSAAATGCIMGTALTINSALTLTSGLIDLAGTTMTLASAVTAAGSANSFVISDLTAGGVLRRNITATSTNYQFPIGDKTGTSDYTPATVNFSAGTFSSAYLGISVQDFAAASGKHPNLDASTDFISRYWSLTTSGTFTSPNYVFTGTYISADVNGAESNCHSNQWNGTQWLNNGTPGGTNTLSITCNTVPATNHITKGYRNAEINIKENVSSSNYLTGSTYDFGTQLTGSNTSVTFTIQNLGQQNLTLSPAVFTGNPPFVYTTAYASPVLGPSGTTTFVVTFSPSAAGTFSGSISITNNDPTGSESPYIINFTGIAVVPAPEMNVKGLTGGSGNIADGSTSPVFSNNTLFTATAIGSSSTKDFQIQNTGTAALTLTGASPYVTITGANAGDFSVTTIPSSSVATSGNTTFVITFAPTAAGTRTATVSIANNDSDENPYNFMIQGTADCATATNVITPLSGPVGTEVTITASANTLTGATATFNGVSATVTQVSSTVIKVIVPAGAISGNLITTNTQGCTATNTFTVIDNLSSTCQGGNTASDLFISEVTDATTGGVSYVEIYNATSNPINVNGYSLKTYSNGDTLTPITTALNSFVLAPQGVYLVALGITASPNSTNTCTGVTGGNGSLANQTTTAAGINFDIAGNDYIGLYKNASASIIDSYGTFGSATWADGLGLGDRGATFRRKNTATVPNSTFSNADWNITDWAGSGQSSCGTNDYSDIGTFNFLSGTPPTVTQNPSFTPSCKSTSLTVAGTEGFAGGNPLVYQWYSLAPGATTWTSLTNTGVYSGATSATLNISSIAGLDGYQFYSQIRENTATCYAASNAVQISEALTVTWNGTSWSPNAPTSTSIAVINGNYNTAANGSFEACSVSVSGGSTLIISASNYVSIQNDLNVSASGTLQVLNQGSLVMIDNNGAVTNSGTTNVIRTTSAYNKYDYTYWSSPVTAAIGTTFPLWRTDYAFQFVTGNYADVVAPIDGFDDDGNAWSYTGTSTVMTPGKGYAIMAPSTGTFPATSTVTFSGAVNNGVINIPMTLSANSASSIDDFNLIGNPYPSAIYANDFINANAAISGTLYFWTHRTGISNTNPGPDANNFITADYAMYNLSGGTSSGTGSAPPTGYIGSGQAFFVETNSATNAVFNNSMRNKAYSNAQFYRMANPVTTPADSAVKDRLWINLQSADGLFSQQLIAYFDNTTLGYDRAYDGVVSQSSNTLSFYSFIESDKYRIQARSAFSQDDVVSLGYSSTMLGTFSVAIDHLEGQLQSDGTSVYLEDKLLGIIHDLKQSPYTFTTAIGTFDDRFVLRYTNSGLGTIDLDEIRNNVVVASSNAQIMVKSYTEPISGIAVYDILGRQVFAKDKISTNEFRITDAGKNQQALIVKVTLENGVVVSRKIVY
jgi:hypothetical protein